MSNTVVPFTTPGPGAEPHRPDPSRPARRGASSAGARPQDNGRPITGYVVDGGQGPQTVTDTIATLTGFGNDEAVEVKVHAVNEAGDGPEATRQRPHDGPADADLDRDDAGYNDISVTFTPNNHGGNATCALSSRRRRHAPRSAAAPSRSRCRSAGCGRTTRTRT